MLIFSQFRETVLYLARALDREYRCEVFHGSPSPDSQGCGSPALPRPAGAQVLISTEAGGEGRNFQFCHVMVNYDLPWNPMRVEQRIGRLDRIGQHHPSRSSTSPSKGTIEERVVEVLTQRIRLFEETVGGIEPILGEVASDLRALIMDQDAQRVARFTENLERSVEQARALERQQADFVMDMRSFSPGRGTAGHRGAGTARLRGSGPLGPAGPAPPGCRSTSARTGRMSTRLHLGRSSSAASAASP